MRVGGSTTGSKGRSKINTRTWANAREIAAGIGLLAMDRKGAWIWARIAGDALDLATLGAALSSRNPKRGNAVLAMAVVSPVVALDLVCGERLGLTA